MTLNIGLLLQPQFQVGNLGPNGAPLFVPADPDNIAQLSHVNEQFFFRRARLFVTGSILKRLTFFVDTDIANWGKGGVWDQPFYVQDAMIMGEWLPDQFIDAGVILVPLSHATLKGAAGLNSMDYAATIMRPPNGVGKAWRDTGVQLRGFFWDKRIQYRAGIFDGVGPDTAGAAVGGMVPTTYVLNPSGTPRVAGILRFNILGRENDFFVKGIYFTEHPIVSIGAGADYQHKATVGAKKLADGSSALYPADYLAVAADVFADIPILTDLELTFEGTFYRHWQGENIAFNNAIGGVGELSLRWRWISVLGLVEYSHGTLSDDANPRANKKEEWMIAHAGVNLWVKRHNANVKFDFGWSRKGDVGATCLSNTTAADFTRTACPGYTGTIQGQVFF